MIDYKKVVEVLKVKFGVRKVDFSKSGRKGEKSLWVCKIPNGEGVVSGLKELVESGEVEGWDVFGSRDGSVVGLKILVG